MRIAFALAGAVLVGGCHHAGHETSDHFEVPLTATAAENDPILATVDGRPIRESEIQTQAHAKDSKDARAALDDLITAEVLAGEAARRGLDRDPEVLEAARAAAVRRELRAGFETDITPSSVPMRDVRRAYQMNINRLDHSEYVDVWHILMRADKKTPDDVKQKARAAAEDLARRARGIGSPEAFQALAATVGKQPFEVQLERVVTARDGWTLKTFSYPAFELKNPGDTSGVVETDYGYHVIYLIKRIPPLHIPVDEAAPKLRESLFSEFQRREFLRYTDELAAHH